MFTYAQDPIHPPNLFKVANFPALPELLRPQAVLASASLLHPFVDSVPARVLGMLILSWNDRK